MPVKKSTRQPTKTTPQTSIIEPHTFEHFMKKIMITLAGILLVYLIVFLGTLIRNNIQKFSYIGQAERSVRSITIDAEGEITARPDIANVTMGVTSEGASVAEAQEENTQIMNKLISNIKTLGINEEDITTTNYNVFPKYKYSEEEGQNIDGYQVSQNISIKIRNLDNAKSVIAFAGELGVTNVSGLSFTLDDREIYINQAREKALIKVKEKASALANNLGVNIISIASYSEYESGQPGPYPLRAYSEFDTGLGGAPPEIEEGTTDIKMNVSVTFEIR